MGSTEGHADETGAGEAEPAVGIGRRGLVGGVIGAVAVGAVGVGVLATRDDDDEPPDPPPAAPDDPPARVGVATLSSTVERRRTTSLEPGSPLARLDELRSASELVDDFGLLVGDPPAPAGWQLTAEGAGAGSVRRDIDGGVLRLTTGTAPTGRVGLRVAGAGGLAGVRSFTFEWRVSVAPAGDGGAGGLVVGYVDSVTTGGTMPAVGYWFAHRSDLSATWLCATAGAGGRTLVDSGVPVDGAFHRLTATCDGGTVVRFAIDDVHVALISTTLPAPEDRYVFGAELFSSAGTVPLTADLDWAYVRRELVR